MHEVASLLYPTKFKMLPKICNFYAITYMHAFGKNLQFVVKLTIVKNKWRANFTLN